MAEGGPIAKHAPKQADPGRLNPAALSVADAALVLTRIGAGGGVDITEAMLHADIDAGAPTNADGTINLVYYAAWLLKELAATGGGRGED